MFPVGDPVVKEKKEEKERNFSSKI